MEDNIKSWLSNQAPTKFTLPACHTTKWSTFEKILKSGYLKKEYSRFPSPSFADVPEENLVYLFYGLPFYIYEIGSENAINVESTTDVPIGLIFKPQVIAQSSTSFPFDTGALFGGKLKGLFDVNSKEDLDDYKVALTDGDEVQKMVAPYFRSNDNYFHGAVNENLKPISPKEEKLQRLHRGNATSVVDHRCTAIEIHSAEDINISELIMCIILPRLRSRKFQSLVNDWRKKMPGVEIKYYHDPMRFNQEQVRAAIISATLDYYDRNPSIEVSLDTSLN